MPKAKISMTISDDLAKEIDRHYRKLVVEAAESGKRIPKKSNVYDEIVRKGWQATKKLRK